MPHFISCHLHPFSESSSNSPATTRTFASQKALPVSLLVIKFCLVGVFCSFCLFETCRNPCYRYTWRNWTAWFCETDSASFDRIGTEWAVAGSDHLPRHSIGLSGAVGTGGAWRGGNSKDGVLWGWRIAKREFYLNWGIRLSIFYHIFNSVSKERDG